MSSAPAHTARAIRLSFYAALLLIATLVKPPAGAQTMARHGWTGTPVSAEPWWHRAVFYRIDPARFQASGAATTGDLSGITLRLDYLRSLGVDALVLAPSADASFDPDALESLTLEAARHNLRIIPSLTPALQSGDRTLLLQTVHEWLGEGAAGIALAAPSPSLPPPGATADTADNASLVPLLAALLRSTPGDRVLLTGAAGLAPVSAPVLAHGGPVGHRIGTPRTGSGQLATLDVVPSAPATPQALQPALAALATATAYPLLRLAAMPRPAETPASLTASPISNTSNNIAAAVVLLASRSAALFDFGSELGLDTARNGTSAAPLMQWTPTNIQHAPAALPGPPADPPAPGQPTPFGAYKPFVRPPPRSLTGNVPAGPLVVLDRNLPSPPPDPSTLPGFTTGLLPLAPVEGAVLNVATQERDPRSTLNAFRALLALRRGNLALREGTQLLLHPAEAQALVFLRRPPPSARTSGTVLVAANLGDTPLVLSLDAELSSLHLPSPHTGTLRALFSDGPQTLTGASTAALLLPPHAVFIGELGSR